MSIALPPAAWFALTVPRWCSYVVAAPFWSVNGSTLGLGLGLLWTEARRRGFGVDRVVDWLCVKTARHAGLADRKGQLGVGFDADVVVWDPDAKAEVRAPTSVIFGSWGQAKR